MAETVTLQIDGTDIEVPAGTSVLDAARQLGIEIPSLCFYAHRRQPRTSCMACVVRVDGQSRLVPSCATPVAEGMQVESETAQVRDARKAAMELLFSDHLGDCIPVCQRICPAHMQIPQVIRLVAAGRLDEAVALVKEHVALPGVVGHICRAACENGCRRGKYDGSVSIRMIERHVAEVDLARDDRYVPAVGTASGKRVAIVGSGPAGLSAAFHLLRRGHACVVFDDRPEPGGMLRYGVPEEELPRAVLDGEIAVIERMGMEFESNARLGRDMTLDELRDQFDAVVLAVGRLEDVDAPDGLSVSASARGIRVGAQTFETDVPGVFAGGAAVHGRREVARSIGDGKQLADCVDAYLQGRPAPAPGRAFTSTIPRLDALEFERFVTGSNAALEEGDPVGEAEEAAGRCCHCDCRAAEGCKLKHYAEAYDVDPRRYAGGERRSFDVQEQHAGVIFEPGKCISCGICVDLTSEAQEPLGLSFIGRGFDVQVGVPFNATIAEGLQKVADAVVRECPTGAIAWKREEGEGREGRGGKRP